MDWALAVAIVVVVAGALALVAGVRRTGAALASTRRAEGFIGAVRDLEARIGVSLGELATSVDGVRRGVGEPESLLPGLAAGQDAMTRYAGEARALHAPPEAGAAREALVYEIERAGRAIELIEHGCRLATSGRRAERGPETETSVKRGYLNLIHAREGIAENAAAAIASAASASPIRRLIRRAPPA